MHTGNPSPTGARLVVTAGSILLFNEDVPIGGQAILTINGNCMPEEFSVLISNTGSNTVRQTVTVNTGCDSNGIPLGATFGAVDFAGFTCQDSTSKNCFTNAEFKTCAVNEGQYR